MRLKSATPETPKPQGWAPLISLHEIFSGGWKLEDEDITRELESVALRYLRDVRRHNLHRRNEFIADISSEDHVSLTDGQSRAVLNVIGGAIRGQRKRWWKSSNTRRDRFGGETNCIVCGGPLSDEESADRGCGPVCYLRIMGDWSAK